MQGFAKFLQFAHVLITPARWKTHKTRKHLRKHDFLQCIYYSHVNGCVFCRIKVVLSINVTRCFPVLGQWRPMQSTLKVKYHLYHWDTELSCAEQKNNESSWHATDIRIGRFSRRFELRPVVVLLIETLRSTTTRSMDTQTIYSFRLN